ncbi:hypothetical protein Tco_1253138 [Tanacetum coccineum]
MCSTRRTSDRRRPLPAHICIVLSCRKTIQSCLFFFKRIELSSYSTANLQWQCINSLDRYIHGRRIPLLDSEAYDIVERVMRPLALRQTRRPQSDRGKARRSISSSSSHHQGTSSHQHDDDDDVKTSRASTSSPTTYINSLHPLDYQNYQIPSLSNQLMKLSLHDKPPCSTKHNECMRRCAEGSNHLERH